MNKLKCKIIKNEPGWYRYIILDDYKIVASGISSNEYYVLNDAGGFHTKKEFDEMYGEGKWTVDFSDMYSNENNLIK